MLWKIHQIICAVSICNSFCRISSAFYISLVWKSVSFIKSIDVHTFKSRLIFKWNRPYVSPCNTPATTWKKSVSHQMSELLLFCFCWRCNCFLGKTICSKNLFHHCRSIESNSLYIYIYIYICICVNFFFISIHELACYIESFGSRWYKSNNFKVLINVSDHLLTFHTVK